MVPGLLGLLALCLTAIAVLHSEWNTSRAIESLMERRVSAFAEIGTLVVRAGVGEGSPRVTRSFFEGLGNVPQFRFAALLDDGGNVVHAASPQGPVTEAEAAVALSPVRDLIARSKGPEGAAVSILSGGQLVAGARSVELPGITRGKPWMVVFLFDLGELKRAERAALLRRASWMGGIAMVAPLLVWWYFVVQVQRPLRRIQDTLARLARGRFESRALAAGAPELVQLAGSVNAMAGELESREAELLRARSDLENSEQCLALALRASNQGMIQYDLSTGLFRMSTWLAERLGWIEVSAGVPLDHWLERVHPADRVAVAGMFEAHRHGVFQQRGEHRIRSGTGGWEWVACESRLVAPESATLVAGSVQIVTERKESYLILVAQSQLLEFIAAGRPLMETLDAILRFAEAQSEGARCSLLLADENRALRSCRAGSMPEDFHRAVDGLPIAEGSGVCGTAAFRQERVVIPDVLQDPACASLRGLALLHGIRACWSTPVLSLEGRVVGTFAMYFRDVRVPSARHDQIIRIATHLAAFAIQRSQDDQGLRESEARFRYLADTAPVMIWMSDATGRTTFLSRPWTEFVSSGRASGEAGETIEQWRERIHPEDLLMCESVWAHALTARRRFEIQYRLRRHDGEFRWLLSSGVPRQAADGEFLGFLGCAFDVTSHRALEDHLRHTQKMESIGRLAAGVAHDFNNILTVILGNTALLPDASPSGVARAADEISAAAQRAAQLTRQLLLFSRQQPFRPRRVDLESLIRGFLGMMSRLVGEDVHIEFQTTGPLSAVDADSGLVEQVLLNLAANARDAMPSGGTIRLLLDTTELLEGPDLVRIRPGRYARLVVKDTGRGIPTEILPRIFDPFFTTKEVGKGTGLGLATVYGILEQHGGRIRVESPPGEGARFEILLPVSLSLEEVEEPVAVPGRLPTGHERILLVEDDPGLLSLADSFLRRHGYQVTPVSSGVEALALWKARGPLFDLLVTDLVMPGGLGGMELGELVRAGNPDLPVLYMSGYSPEFSATGGAGLAPGVDFLQKPYSMGELVRLVRARLDRGVRNPAAT